VSSVIAKHYGCSVTTVERALRQYGLVGRCSAAPASRARRAPGHDHHDRRGKEDWGQSLTGEYSRQVPGTPFNS
jgi:hypothetical protein